MLIKHNIIAHIALAVLLAGFRCDHSSHKESSAPLTPRASQNVPKAFCFLELVQTDDIIRTDANIFFSIFVRIFDCDSFDDIKRVS